ncbi:hypothetical protein Tco_1191419 [Tanacetum coccineum]
MSKASCPETQRLITWSTQFLNRKGSPENNVEILKNAIFFVGMSFTCNKFPRIVLKDDLQQDFLLLFCLEFQCQILGAIGSTLSRALDPYWQRDNLMANGQLEMLVISLPEDCPNCERRASSHQFKGQIAIHTSLWKCLGVIAKPPKGMRRREAKGSVWQLVVGLPKCVSRMDAVAVLGSTGGSSTERFNSFIFTELEVLSNSRQILFLIWEGGVVGSCSKLLLEAGWKITVPKGGRVGESQLSRGAVETIGQHMEWD